MPAVQEMQEVQVQSLDQEDALAVRRRKWQPTPVFLPGESYGQRSLEAYSPWGRKEPYTTEATWHTHISLHGPVSVFCYSF